MEDWRRLPVVLGFAEKRKTIGKTRKTSDVRKL